MDESCIPRETEGETAQGAGGTNRNVEFYIKMLFFSYQNSTEIWAQS
jgi:hypothetical protein